MAQFTVYKSTDGSAPVLTGENGKLVDLLDACLVNGYGSQSAAGWAKSYSGTSKAVYRAPSGSRLYLRVQDDGPGAGGAKEARLRGYETMSDVDTGSNLFPTAAQLGSGIIARKSQTANSTARAWIVAADARTVYVFISTGDSAGKYSAFMFGEIYSAVPSDSYNSMIIGRVVEDNGDASNEHMDRLSTTYSVQAGHYIARKYDGVGTAQQMSKHGDVVKGGGSAMSGSSVVYPNPGDGGLYMGPIWAVHEHGGGIWSIRGRLRGIWEPHSNPSNFTDGDTVSGVGELSGKSFLKIKNGLSGGTSYWLETSNTLETN